MKKFFFYAFAAIAALSITSCGDSDDEGGNESKKNVTLTEAPYAKEAISYDLSMGGIEGIYAQNDIEEVAGKIVGVSITESGYGVVEVKMKDGETKFVEEKVTIKDKTFTFNGKTIKGTFTEEQPTVATAPTRASVATGISANVTITIPGWNPITFNTTSPADALIKATIGTGGQILTYLVRTWTVNKMIIDLEGDVKAYKEISGGNLDAIRAEAEKHGATFTEDEVEDFNKSIESVTVSADGLITLKYTDGVVDAGDWTWANSQFNTLNLKLKDKGMGNKYFTDNTKIAIDFNGNQCSFKLSTDIKGNKNYKAALTFVMQ